MTVNAGGKLLFGADDGAGYYQGGTPSSITLNGGILQGGNGTHSTLPSLFLNAGTVTALAAGDTSGGIVTNFILDGNVTTTAGGSPSTISAPTIVLRVAIRITPG